MCSRAKKPDGERRQSQSVRVLVRTCVGVGLGVRVCVCHFLWVREGIPSEAGCQLHSTQHKRQGRLPKLRSSTESSEIEVQGYCKQRRALLAELDRTGEEPTSLPTDNKIGASCIRLLLLCHGGKMQRRQRGRNKKKKIM